VVAISTNTWTARARACQVMPFVLIASGLPLGMGGMLPPSAVRPPPDNVLPSRRVRLKAADMRRAGRGSVAGGCGGGGRRGDVHDQALTPG
jgi:hypothetical protein